MANGVQSDTALKELSSQLGRDEKILFVCNPDKKAWVVTRVGAILIVSIFAFIWSIVLMVSDFGLGALCMGGYIVFIVVVVLGIMIALKHTTYAATDRRVISQTGILSKTFKEAPYDRITDTVVLRPFLARIFGAGTIGFNTAGGGGARGPGVLAYEVVWINVSDPVQVKSRMSELIEQQKKSKKMEEFKMMAQQMGTVMQQGGGASGGGAFCGNCGAQSPPGKRYCISCGSPL